MVLVVYLMCIIMLKSVREGTTVLSWRCVDVCSLKVLFAMNLTMMFGMCVDAFV